MSVSLFKKKTILYARLESNGSVLYSGRWNDLPLAEEVILKKSVEFFDDADPCYIHRNAVRVRLISELEGMKSEKDRFLETLSEWTGLGTVDACEFSQLFFKEYS